jgi:hypothetical protein
VRGINIGVSKLNPDNLFSLDLNGNVTANDFYISCGGEVPSTDFGD